MQNKALDCMMIIAEHHHRPLRLDPKMRMYLCSNTARGLMLQLFVVEQQAAAGRKS